MKFEYVFGGVMPSPAGVNASLSKDLDHVGEAEICCIRRGRSQCRRGDVCGRGLRQCSTNPATRHWWCEDLKTPPIFVINCHDSLEEVVIEFEWGRLVCESKGFGIHNRL